VSRKSKLGDNPLTTLTGGQVAAVRSVERYPTVSYRLPPDIAAEVRAIAKKEGVEVGQVAAHALRSFCERYRNGEALPVRELATVRRVVDITQ
jgi:hypothetical protein